MSVYGPFQPFKETALKEEKKKKEMAPPSNVPSRPGGPSVGSPQNSGTKKNKGTPPIQSPPSEEVEEILQQHIKVILTLRTRLACDASHCCPCFQRQF